MDAPIEIPLCDPEVAPPWPAPGRTSLLLDQLISPTSKENLHGMSAIQWFGVDIGGTLVKCVYFEPLESEEKGEGGEGVAAMRSFVRANLKYGSTGIRDQRLEMAYQTIGGQTGTLHFIKFATSRMDGFFDMVTNNGLGKFPKIVCATGGGAFKFEDDFRERLGVNLRKADEMASLIWGLHYICGHYNNECYYWARPKTPDACKIPYQLGPDPYPYIIVNIGSGVSILLVKSGLEFKRIGGTSVGGGTFLGLSSMLAGTSSFEDAIALAERGDSDKVDKLVRDIYGGDYEKYGLRGDVVACSFGHMISAERRAEAKPEDLAKALLVTVTNNIGAIAMMCASISSVEKIVFVGNYLCGNTMSMQMLAYAVEFWSKGTIHALFLEHEGYSGALGAMLHTLDPGAVV